MVLAIYLPLQNGYNFSAAFPQAPRFDPSASDAANYGAVGATNGHETSHCVDTLGADYDASGGMVHWWLPEDEAKYKTLSETLVAQYSGYHPFPDLSVAAVFASESKRPALAMIAVCSQLRHYRPTSVRLDL